jgi:hypothetical protein
MTMITNQPSGIATFPQSQTTAGTAVSVQVENGSNLEWPKAKPWLEKRAQIVLDTSGKSTEKERAQAFSEIQTWFVAGPKGGRTAETVPEIDALGTKIAESDLNSRLRAIGDMQALTMSVANTDGKNGFTAGIEFMKGLSKADREVYFTATITPDKMGQYAYKSEGDFFANMTRLESKWQSPSVGNGNVLTPDEMASHTRLEAAQAQNRIALGRLRSEYNNLVSGARFVTDTIELSGTGAKAAAKTLPTSGANDVALKALETLKEVGEQQREWAKSLAEEEAAKPFEAASDSTALQVSANIAKPGSVLSIAA